MPDAVVTYDMPFRSKLPTTGIQRRMPTLLVHALALVIFSGALAGARDVPLRMNGVQIHGVREIFEVNFGANDLATRDALRQVMHNDGFDAVLMMREDSTLLLAYGLHLLLYADSTDRVLTARSNGVPVTILYLDDENQEFDTRPPLGVWMLSFLIAIVVAGGIVGSISGIVARRGLAAIGRDPLLEQVFYGLVVGLLVALLWYGMSEKRFDLDGLLATYSTEHLIPFMKYPPR